MSVRTCSIAATTLVPFSTSRIDVSAVAVIASASDAISVWISPTRSAMSLALFSATSARARTSSATTAKPLPAWPARAASIAALSASRSVWSAM